jgi:hypothetical protein
MCRCLVKGGSRRRPVAIVCWREHALGVVLPSVGDGVAGEDGARVRACHGGSCVCADDRCEL